jgi:hypothetical protein
VAKSAAFPGHVGDKCSCPIKGHDGCTIVESNPAVRKRTNCATKALAGENPLPGMPQFKQVNFLRTSTFQFADRPHWVEAV